MSSVSGSDSSNRQDEAVRRNREDYQKKESQLVKKHNKELRSLAERHYADLENVKEAHQGQMANMQSKAQEQITRRDIKHQREVDKLREMHRKQIEGVAGETQRNAEVNAKVGKQEVEAAKRQFSERLGDLESTHRQESETQKEDYIRALTDLRENQKQSVETYRSDLTAHHEKEAEAQRQAHLKEQSELSRNYTDYRKTAEHRSKTDRIRNMQDREKDSRNHLNNIRRERQNANFVQENMREGFRETTAEGNERYANKIRTIEEQKKNLSQDQLESISARVENKIGHLEEKIKDLEEKNIKDRVRADNMTDKLVSNTRRESMANIEDYRQQRDRAVEQLNDGNFDDIRRVHSEKDKVIQATNKFYRDKLETQNYKSKEAFINLKSDFDARVEQSALNAEARVEKVRSSVDQQSNRINERHKASLDILKTQQSDELKSLQFKQAEERQQIIERLKEQMRKREFQHQEKISSMTITQEKKLAELNDKLTGIKRKNNDNLKRVVEEMSRSHHKELEMQQTLYKDKVAQMQISHDNEIKDVGRRHQEQVDQLLTTIRKT